MSTIGVGNLSESLVLAAYISAGFAVSVPFGNGCAYDLVVDAGSRLYKVQVKTGWKRNGCLICKSQRRVKDSTHNGLRRYREDEVDFFAVYFPPLKSIYVIPSSMMAGSGSLRFDPVRNGQQKMIKWATNYSWEKHLEQLQEFETPFSSQVLETY